MSLREQTKEKHKEAEQLLFNKRLLNGELSEYEYAMYLFQQLKVFHAIELKIKLPEDLKRTSNIDDDLFQLEERNLKGELYELKETTDYVNYLDTLNQEEIMVHVYLNYMALLFGGQIIKNNIYGQGHMYVFKNKSECIDYIRSKQKDTWADEVNLGFTYNIRILKALENIANV